jgi:hypothetical protein
MFEDPCTGYPSDDDDSWGYTLYDVGSVVLGTKPASITMPGDLDCEEMVMVLNALRSDAASLKNVLMLPFRVLNPRRFNNNDVCVVFRRKRLTDAVALALLHARTWEISSRLTRAYTSHHIGAALGYPREDIRAYYVSSWANVSKWAESPPSRNVKAELWSRFDKLEAAASAEWEWFKRSKYVREHVAKALEKCATIWEVFADADGQDDCLH